jgi:hypothetical protein
MGNSSSGDCCNFDQFVATRKTEFLSHLGDDRSSKTFAVGKEILSLLDRISNFVVLAPGSTSKHFVYQFLKFSVCLLYESDVPLQAHTGAIVQFHGSKFGVISLDLISVSHLSYFLPKSKIFLGHREFLTRVLDCSGDMRESGLDRFATTTADSPTKSPIIKFINPAEGRLAPMSESVFQSSSLAAFQTYQRSRSGAELTELTKSDMTESDLLASSMGPVEQTSEATLTDYDGGSSFY